MAIIVALRSPVRLLPILLLLALCAAVKDETTQTLESEWFIAEYKEQQIQAYLDSWQGERHLHLLDMIQT